MSENQNMTSKKLRPGFKIGKWHWSVVIGIVLMHAGAIAAPFYFSWSGLFIALFFWWISGGLGITLCYHRLLTHRSFKSPKWFEYFLTVCGCLAWQGGPAQWVGTHRLHHKHSDEEMDPHSPKHGFTWAHMTWCLHRDPEDRNAKGAAKDLMRDKGHVFLDKYFWLPQLVLAILLIAGGELANSQLGWTSASGVSWFLWGICLRTIFVYHVTWFVNSASHTWGYRNYETKDHSTNLWWVGLLGFGEGWHNNHHAHQRSAAHGLRWYEFDITFITIKLLAKLGLARDIVLPKDEEMPK